MAVFKVFKERDTEKYKGHTFENEIEHLEYLLTQYVVKDEKVISREWIGINCNDDPRIAYEEMIATKMEFGKYNPDNTKSREFKHYTIAFPHDESKELGAYQINNMVKEICERIPEFRNFQISITTHEDKEHIHSHIIINSVNLIDGHKIQLPDTFLIKAQAICNEYTKEKGLTIHKLPYSLKFNETNTSFNYVDYNAHTKGKISKTEEFANRINDVIKDTKNKYDLFKAMKENNLKMLWRDDKQYSNKLSLGKITIIDNTTGEKHRLETLVRKYNINITNNIDLFNHFRELDKINEFKTENIIRGIKIDKNDLIKINNTNELKDKYNTIKEHMKNYINEKYYYKLPTSLKNEMSEYVQELYNNSNELKEKVEIKTKEILIKAKEIDKNLDYESERKSIENHLNRIMAQKIFNEMKRKHKASITTISLLIKSLIYCINSCNYDNLNNSRKLDKLLSLEEKKKLEQDIKKAITY